VDAVRGLQGRGTEPANPPRRHGGCAARRQRPPRAVRGAIPRRPPADATGRHAVPGGRADLPRRWGVRLRLGIVPTDDSDRPTPDRYLTTMPFRTTDVRSIEGCSPTSPPMRTQASGSGWSRAVGVASVPFRPHVIARHRRRLARSEVSMGRGDPGGWACRGRGGHELRDRYHRHGEVGLLPKPRPAGTHLATVSPTRAPVSRPRRVQTAARVKVTCVTPLGEEVASTW
jgi:hypothetical protein